MIRGDKQIVLSFIGAVCRKEREKANCSVMEFATNVGYTYGNIQMFEAGKVNNLLLLYAYCKFFSKDIMAYVFESIGEYNDWITNLHENDVVLPDED